MAQTEVNDMVTIVKTLPYPEAETLADLVPGKWRIIGYQKAIDRKYKQTLADYSNHTRYTIPNDEIKTVEYLRDKGAITTALYRDGQDFLLLAQRLVGK